MMMTIAEREKMMVAEYGEVCTQVQAGKILSRHPQTIRNMAADGRLAAACGGTMIDVRSIADYIMHQAENESETRRRKRGRKWQV